MKQSIEVCGSQNESIKHVFFECNLSIEIWRSIQADLLDHANAHGEDMQSWKRLFDFFQEKDLIEIGMNACWSICHAPTRRADTWQPSRDLE